MTIVDAKSVIVDLLERGHAVRFRVHGDSMHPVIRAEDVVHVEPGRACRVGDVILTLTGRGLTAHRVTRIDAERIITRGDNAPADDDPVDVSCVLGRVTSVERNGVERTVRRENFVLRWLRRIRRAV